MSADVSAGSKTPHQGPQPCGTHTSVPDSAQDETSPKVGTARLMLYAVVVILVFGSITYAATVPSPH